MKKALGFILALVMLLSITTASFANISAYQVNTQIPEFRDYIGFWQGDSKSEAKCSVIIGKVEESLQASYVAILTTVKNKDDEIDSTFYYLSYDLAVKAVYMSKSERGVDLKAVIKDNQLVLYDMYDNAVYAKLNKIN